MFLYVFNYYIISDILKILFCISIVINTFESIEGSMIQNYIFPKKIKQRLQFDGYIFENVIIIQIKGIKILSINQVNRFLHKRKDILLQTYVNLKP